MRRASSLSESELKALRALETIRQLQAGDGTAEGAEVPPLETGFEKLTPVWRARWLRSRLPRARPRARPRGRIESDEPRHVVVGRVARAVRARGARRRIAE